MARPTSKPNAVDRRAPQPVPPQAEDTGLFRRPVVQVPLQLGAAVYRNNRNDLIFTGFSDGALSFEVVFAGRRAIMAAPLVSHVASVVEAARLAARRRAARFDPDTVRVPIVLDGAWRTRVWQDEAGWALRVHQLVVAQWRLGNRDAGGKTYGLPPCTPDV